MESEDVLQHALPNRPVRETQEIFSHAEEVQPSGSNVAVQSRWKKQGEEEDEDEDVAIADDGRDSFFANLGDGRTVVKPNGMRMNRLPLSSGMRVVNRHNSSQRDRSVHVGTEMMMEPECRNENRDSVMKEGRKTIHNCLVRSKCDGDVDGDRTEVDMMRSGRGDIAWNEERRTELRRGMYVETAELDYTVGVCEEENEVNVEVIRVHDGKRMEGHGQWVEPNGNENEKGKVEEVGKSAVESGTRREVGEVDRSYRKYIDISDEEFVKKRKVNMGRPRGSKNKKREKNGCVEDKRSGPQ